ncbi:MAG: hypothetical protein ABFS32_22905 [Bacteroidota bacterium]
MPNQIIWENKGVLSRFDGIFSPEIHTTAINKLFSDSRIDGVKYMIGDFSQVNGDLMNEVDVEYPLAMTTGAARYLKDLKIALIAVDKKIIELCKLYIQLSSRVNKSWEVRIFDNIDTARDWIARG